MRICHLGKFYPPASGGIETHVRVLAQAQAKLGIAVQVVCMNHQPGPTVYERDDEVDVIRAHRRGTAAKVDYCPGLVRTLQGLDADLIHVQLPNPTMILALLAARIKQPLVVTYQSDHIRQRVRGMLFRPVERWFFQRVRAILATSPTYPGGSSLLASYPDRLQILPMGIDLEPYLEPSAAVRDEARRIQARSAGPIWLCCGRLIYYKGMMNAVRALAQLPGTLWIVGDGPERRMLEAEAERLSIRDRIVFAGALPYREIIPYYLAADAFWFPSNARSEAFGLVQVEAMASGCPVINTSIPHSGVSWVSRHEQTGLTVPVNDVPALVAASRRLLDEPGLRQRLAAGGKTRAQAEFDHHVMARRSLEVYREVLGVSPANDITRARVH